MIGKKGKQGEHEGLGYGGGGGSRLWDSAKFMRGCLGEGGAGRSKRGIDRKGASHVKWDWSIHLAECCA